MFLKVLRFFLILLFFYLLSPIVLGAFSSDVCCKEVGKVRDEVMGDGLQVDADSFRLYIPAIGLTEYVQEGRGYERGLKDSLWHLPYTPAPDAGGNTVIVGHSINYGSIIPPPFFYLNRVEIGDIIKVEYGGELFMYEIYEKIVVGSKEVDYEKSSEGQHIITLYTCTPILNPVNRLVVIGRVVSID